MDFDTEHPNNSLGGVAFPPESVAEILAYPQLAIALFELTIFGREQPGGNALTPSALADHLPTDDGPDPIETDLERLRELRAANKTGHNPATYTSAGYQISDAPVDLPDGSTVSFLPPLMVGMVAYAAVAPSIAEVFDRQGYEFVHTVANLAISDQFDSLDVAFPSVPDEDIEAVRPAVEYAYQRLDDDPLWDWEVVDATLSM